MDNYNYYLSFIVDPTFVMNVASVIRWPLEIGLENVLV